VIKINIPDNLNAFEQNEAENERWNRIHKKQEYEEDIEIEDLPYYMPLNKICKEDI
jgi:hypothetical protein